MTKIIAKTYSVTREYQSEINYIMLFTCLIFALIYGLNLYRTISLTVGLQKLDTKIEEVKSSVQTLEAQYIGISNNITPEMAKEYGLHEVPVSAYISRNTSLGTVALKRSEI